MKLPDQASPVTRSTRNITHEQNLVRTKVYPASIGFTFLQVCREYCNPIGSQCFLSCEPWILWQSIE